MTDAITLDRRLAALERTVRRQRVGLLSLALVLGVVGLASWRAAYPEVLRAQRFIAMDDRGNEVGHFGFEREGEVPSISWLLDNPDTGAFAFCFVGRDLEEGAAPDMGVACLQMEAGWAISQHCVRELNTSIGQSYIIGDDEKTAMQLTANATTSELVLSPLPHGAPLTSEESDESHALRLTYDTQGPRVSGVDLEGASKIRLP